MIKSFSRFRSITHLTRTIGNLDSSVRPVCAWATSRFSTANAPRAVPLQSNSTRDILQPSFKPRFSIRNVNRFSVDGEEDIDEELLFSAEIDPTYYDEPLGDYRRDNYGQDGFGSSLDKVKYDEADLEVFPKHFYNESEATANRAEEEINAFYNENSITVQGQNSPKPILTFDEIEMSESMLHRLQSNRFDKPMPIQSIAWPVTLSGRNVIGIAQTGSGKTLSFLLPALTHINAQVPVKPGHGPIALVLCPTRELAKQCNDVARQFFPRDIYTSCVYGGDEKRRQISELSRGCSLVIATPGRLMDLLQSGVLTLQRCSFLVLDEADRMLDMGFEPQIRKIINQIRPDRQVTMWSATWPKEVSNLASTYLMSDEDPVYIKIGSAELQANQNVKQNFKICANAKKDAVFMGILKNSFEEFKEKLPEEHAVKQRKQFPKVLVFANKKRTCDDLTYRVRKAGVNASAIHGDLSQMQRDNVLKSFRTGSTSIMIATDVAARGLDVHNIEYVINYDMPTDCVSYIHRIGRTGRAGKEGTSWTMLTENDGIVVKDLIKSLQNIDHPVDEKLLKLEQWWESKKHGIRRKKREQTRSQYPRFQQTGFNTGPRHGRYNRESYGDRRYARRDTDEWDSPRDYNKFDDSRNSSRNFFKRNEPWSTDDIH